MRDRIRKRIETRSPSDQFLGRLVENQKIRELKNQKQLRKLRESPPTGRQGASNRAYNKDRAIPPLLSAKSLRTE